MTTYETPYQYKKRTGKDYPDRGPVWVFYNMSTGGDDYEDAMRLEEWGNVQYEMYLEPRKYKNGPCPVCAYGDNVPDVDYEPEEYL